MCDKIGELHAERDERCSVGLCSHIKFVVHASNQLRQQVIVVCIQVEPYYNSTPYRCFETLLVDRTGKSWLA